MGVLAILGVIFLLAFLVESMTEYIFGELMAHIPGLQSYSWTLKYIAMTFGIFGAFAFKFNLVYIASDFFGAGLEISQFGVVFGTVLTGMSIGRGAVYIHEIVSKYFKKPDAPSIT